MTFMHAMADLEVRIKATHRVKPAEKTWTGTINLTEMDTAGERYMLPFLYLYPPNTHRISGAAMVEPLKDSLSKALVHFYPFAGRLRRAAEACEVALECEAAAMWVPLVEAECRGDVEVADLVGGLATEAAVVDEVRLRGLVPAVDLKMAAEELPLLAVQVTHFRCGGVGVGVRMCHAVADGRGMSHFLSEWTRLARGEPLKMAPVHNRALLRAGEPPKPTPLSIKDPVPPLMTQPPTINTNRDPNTPILNMRLSKAQVDKLKMVSGEAVVGRPYTRYEVVVAHTWRYLSRTNGRKGEDQQVFGVVADIRKRMNPWLPETYLGNAYITMPSTSVSSDDLASKPLGYACSLIRQTINEVTEEYVGTVLEQLKSKVLCIKNRLLLSPKGGLVMPDLRIVSWLNMSFFGLDFGWGKEVLVMISPPIYSGFGYLLPGREEGSAIVSVYVEAAHVEAFKRHFYLLE